jgi:hypothetical protein
VLPLDNFNGGLWLPGDANSADPQPGFAVPANALLEAENVEYQASGAVRGRRGRARRYTQLENSVVALARHYSRVEVASTSTPFFANLENIAGGGPVPWTPEAGQPYLTAHATFAPNTTDTSTNFLRWTEAAWHIPAGARITGLQFDLTHHVEGGEGSTSYPTITASMQLAYQGQSGPHVEANTANWVQLDENGLVVRRSVTDVFGSPTTLWDGLTPAELNDPTFGVYLYVTFAGPGNSYQVEVFVEAIKVTVYFEGATRPSQIVGTVGPVAALGGFVALRYFASNDAGELVVPNIDLNNLPAPPLAAPTFRPHFAAWSEKGATFIADGTNPMQRYSHNYSLPSTRRLVAVEQSGTASQVSLPTGPYLTLWKSRLWATTPGELSFSVYGSEVNDETTWFADVQLSVNDPKGGKITGLVGLASLSAPLVILKDTCLFSFLGDPLAGGQLNLYSTVGCTAPETVQECPWGVIYLGHGGLYLTDAQSMTPTDLSGAIATLFAPRTANEPTPYPSAIGVFHPRRNQYWLKLDPDVADGYVLQFIPAAGGGFTLAWSHVPTMPLNAACVWVGSPDQGELIAGGLDGWIREFDTGTTDDTDGGPEPIPVTIRTRSQLLDDRSPMLRLGRVAYLKPQYRGAQRLNGVIRYEEDNTNAVPFFAGAVRPTGPAFQEPRTTITDLAHSGRVVDFLFTNPTDGPNFELHRVQCDVQLRTVRRWP